MKGPESGLGTAESLPHSLEPEVRGEGVGRLALGLQGRNLPSFQSFLAISGTPWLVDVSPVFTQYLPVYLCPSVFLP